MNNEENKPIEMNEENIENEEIEPVEKSNKDSDIKEINETLENTAAEDIPGEVMPGSTGVVDNIDLNGQIEENEYRDALSENENETENLLNEKSEPEHKINSSLKIAAVILGVFALVFAAFMLFINPNPDNAIKNSGLVGSWLNRTGDIASYYTFTEDGRLIFTAGTIDNLSGYGIELDTDKTFYIYSYGKDPEETKAGALQYDIYNEDGVETLKIITSATGGKDLILKKSELPGDLIKPVENFKGNEKLFGEWHNEEQNLTLIFSEDGLLKLDFSDMIYNSNYIIEDNTIKFTYYKDFSEESKATDQFFFSVEGDKMNLYMSDPATDASPIVFDRVLTDAKVDK